MAILYNSYNNDLNEFFLFFDADNKGYIEFADLKQGIENNFGQFGL
jgi:Ca2+-binding EF-hand superfamily protein